MTPEFAQSFVADWIDAWNEHDVNRVLAHFHDDVEFRSPIAARILEGSDGIVHGKAALADYWRFALTQRPNLHFRLLHTFVGVGVVVIHYSTDLGNFAAEVLSFEGELVKAGWGTYEPTSG